MSLNLDNVIEAIEEAKRRAKKRNFIQSIELIIKLRDVDVKKPENRINIEVPLPNPPNNKLAKVAVFASGDLALKAKEANADLVIDREDLEKLATNKKSAKELAKKYDFFIAQADLMPLIGRYLGRYLGPRGKMPKPVPPTVDINAILERYRRSVRVRVKDQPQVMCRIGVETQDSKQIAENIDAILEALRNKFKIPQNIERIYVKLTMGPAVEIKIK